MIAARLAGALDGTDGLDLDPPTSVVQTTLSPAAAASSSSAAGFCSRGQVSSSQVGLGRSGKRVERSVACVSVCGSGRRILASRAGVRVRLAGP